MLKPIIAVYDKKVGLFDNPITVRHVGDALREFDTIRKDSNTKYGKHPEDFDLYQLGTYDEQKGELVTLQPHLQLATGI